jgi:hypothetical protein
MRRLALLLTGTALALSCATAAAAEPTAQPWPHGLPATDGVGTAAWTGPGRAVMVFDDAAEAPRRAGTLLRRCQRSLAVAGGRVATLCDRDRARGHRRWSLRLMDLATGRWERLPDETPVHLHARPAYTDEARIAALSPEAVTISVVSKSNGSATFSLTTGERLETGPAGWQPLCEPLSLPEYKDPESSYMVAWPSTYRPPYLVSKVELDVVLQRCGEDGQQTIGVSSSDVELTVARALWLDRTSLVVHDPATGDQQRVPMPPTDARYPDRALQATSRRAWALIRGAEPETVLVDLAPRAR